MLDAGLVREALNDLAVSLGGRGEIVELILIGAAGAALAGDLSGDRVTLDCDVVACAPEGAWEPLARAAGQIAERRSLDPSWLNRGAAVWIEAFPPGWMGRVRTVMRVGRLRVRVPARTDLIASKALAGRPRDLEDLLEMAPTISEWRRARDHFRTFHRDDWPEQRILAAIETIEELAGPAIDRSVRHARRGPDGAAS